ncbi:condensin-2 complex subunit H2-like isoform X2 [Branchiostoma lanceolatum]|uniref:condensin-2 complex subunit H2-like isoform X2 n=1 Tax=Branchiostoma lanceolatum TaxID=7740 RepID=UPI003452409C
MTLSQDPNAVDKRFAHLLQPIKDLTKNWDVNLAAELENYLEELNTIPFSFDGGVSTMNFVEAALLIQGSACVYSRKVELLYTLVYQSLEMLASKKRQKQGSSLDEDGQDKDAPANKAWEEPEFLSLDDDNQLRPGKRSIELKPDQNRNVVIVQRVPMALTPLEEGEKKNAELVSKKGETLGSRLDFTVNFALLHSPDTLMLDRSNCSKLNLTEDTRWITPGAGLEAAPGTEILPPPPNLPMNTSVCSDDGTAEPLPLGDDPADMDDVGGGELGGGDLEWDNPERNAASEPRNLRPRVQVVEPKEQVKKDPWKLLDPHEEQPITNAKSLPFKKGVAFQVLPGLSGTTKKRKLKAASAQLEPLPDLISKTVWGDKKLPTNPTKRPTFAALEHLYWDAMRKRRELQKQLKTEQVPEYLEEEEDEQEGFPVLDHNDDDDDDVNADDFGGGAIGMDTEAAPPMPIGLEEELPKDSMVHTYEDMVRQYVDGFLESAQYIQETQLSRRIREWEEKILPHLEEEERHGPFDIHSCADQLLESFHTVGEVRPLHEVCRGQAAWGVCRTFASSLQLANNMNLKIGQTGVADSAVNTMTLTLLSKERAQERFQDYQAPSLTQKTKKGHK